MAKAPLSHKDARAQLIRNVASARVYGVPLADSANDEHHVMLLCGWAFGGEDRREPSDRIVHVRKRDVADSGIVPGFEHRGQPVAWYEVGLDAQLVEEIYLSLSLGSLLPIRLGSTARRAGEVPVTIDPGGPRPTQSPPLTIGPGDPRPTGAPPGTIMP